MRNNKDNKRRLIKILAVILFILVAGWIISWIPGTTELEIVPEGNVRCVLITDLHSCYYGKDMKTLVKMVDKQDPDIIFLSGDIFDDKIPDDNTKDFLEQIAGKYICFYVTGNHEYWSGRVDEMCSYVDSLGITVLRGECSAIEVNGKIIDVCGVDDPTYMADAAWKSQLEVAWEGTTEEHYKILLSHRPEKVEEYEEYDFDLILTGHAHGGQIMIPFLNRGLLAPDQWLFPKYVNGIYELSNGSQMIVSRGLARESTPLPRYFNNPEMIAFYI